MTEEVPLALQFAFARNNDDIKRVVFAFEADGGRFGDFNGRHHPLSFVPTSARNDEDDVITNECTRYRTV